MLLHHLVKMLPQSEILMAMKPLTAKLLKVRNPGQ